MTVKTGTAWAGTFLTVDATGALATPSTGPAGVLYVDGTANAAEVTITGTNPYKFAVTLPALTAGQRVDMYITATIDTIATGNVVASEQADTALTSEVKTETAAILEDTGTTLDTLIKDIPTNAELATALGTADDATLAAIAAIKTILDDLHDTDLPAVKAETALIVEDTGTTLHARLILVEQILRNKMITDPATGVMTLYDDAGTSALLTANIFQDAAGTQAYQGQGAERRERLA